MELIYINLAAQEIVKDEQMYKKWLSELKEGDLVLTQKFSSPAPFTFPFEKWLFQVSEFQGNKIARGDIISNFDKSKGWLTFEDGEPLYFVFPIRIVPISPSIKIDFELGKSVGGHCPIYEPLFLGKFRHVYYVGDSSKSANVDSAIWELYPYSYKFNAQNYMNDINTGKIYHCFGDRQPQVIDGATYLYSQQN